MTVQVRNLTRGTVLADGAQVARDLWARAIGLMGRSHLPPGYALVFPGVRGVHTHFMRLPVDLVVYAPDGTVLDVVAALRPWRCTRYYRRAAGVIELPAGAAHASGTVPGDTLALPS